MCSYCLHLWSECNITILARSEYTSSAYKIHQLIFRLAFWWSFHKTEQAQTGKGRYDHAWLINNTYTDFPMEYMHLSVYYYSYP